MEKVKTAFSKMSLRKSMLCIFLFIIIIISLIACLTVVAAQRVQVQVMNSRHLVIDMENVEYDSSNNIIINSSNWKWEPLTDNEKKQYYGSTVAMIILPIIYLLFGGYIMVILYYNMKLKRPVNVLRRAVDNININNLEFEVDYYNQDELGTLCTAVEKMRYELFKSKSQVSKLIQEKRVLTVSIDHDVSAPITEIKGYIGYLQKNIHNMKIFKDDISETLYKMDKLALRLGNYVDCVKEVQIYEKID